MKWKKTLLSILLAMATCYVWGQDTISGSFVKLHLVKKNYVINDVISITDSLIIDPGVTVQLGNNVTIVCLGSIMMNGTAGGRIKITSRKNQTGAGIVIAAQSNYAIQIKYTSFDSLVMPLSFAAGWFRPEVTIRSSQFIHNVGTTSVIQVLNPTVPPSDVPLVATFKLSQSLFTGNIAPITFEDLQSDFFKIDVVGNSFVGNKISGYGQYTFSGNMIFGRMDKMQSIYKANIRENSFVYNFLRDIDADTLIQQADIGIYGNADSLAVPSNYWGTDNEPDARKRIFDYTSNYNSPKLVITPLEFAPPDSLPPHVYDIINTSGRMVGQKKMKFIDDKWQEVGDTASYITYSYNLRQGLRSFRMVTNRPVLSRLMTVHFMYYKDSLTLADTSLTFKKDETVKNNITITFGLQIDSMFKSKPGYLLVKGMDGQQGEFVPEVLIGYESFLKYVNNKKAQFAMGRFLKPNDSSIQKIKDPTVIRTKFKKKYELGLVAGNAIYYGTLSNKDLFKNDFNSIFGLQFRYALKPLTTFCLSILTTTLTGSDLRSGDSTKIARGMSFKDPVTALSFQFEFEFIDNRYYSPKTRIRPSIALGLDYIKFNPMGEYLGKWYPLEPMGTGGQTLPGNKTGPYPLSTLGSPVTFQIRYFLNIRTIFTAFVTYHLTFTNYLDDVGPDPYPDPVALAKANPTNPDAAVYFSNPTNRVVTKGTLRSGSADGADSFFTFGFSLSHHF